MSEFRQKFDLARKRLRDKLGLPAAIPSEIGSSAGSTEDSGEGSSVLHRVLAFEHQKPAPDAFNPQDSDIIPSPAALSHSLSGRWKQRVGDDGKPFWQRNEREAASSEVGWSTWAAYLHRALTHLLYMPNICCKCSAMLIM